MLLSVNTKPNVYRVYLNEEFSTLLKEVCEKTEMQQTEILSRITQSGLRAIKDANYRISLPLRFKLHEPETEQPSPEKPARGTKR